MTTTDHTIKREDHRNAYDKLYAAVKADFQMIVEKTRPDLIERELRLMLASKVAVFNAKRPNHLSWGSGSSHLYVSAGSWNNGPGPDYSRILIIRFNNNYNG